MTTQIYWRDPACNLLTILGNYIRLEYARGENKVGWMDLTLNPASIPASFLRLNSRLEPWRQVGANAPYLDGETVFFLRSWSYAMNYRGEELLTLRAYDANYLLDSRIVAYNAGSAQAERTNEADDMMKSIVRDNLGADATDTLRDLGTAFLTVQADMTLAPSMTKGFSRRNVLLVLQELADASLQAGTYLSFDIVYTGATTLEFRTFTSQRGINHGRTSSLPVVVSRERRNLEQPELIEDHGEVRNYIYAGGQGEGADRVIKTASLTDALGQYRREYFTDARMSDDENAVQNEANTELYAQRARKTLTGRIIDTEGCRDGVNYRFGDLVYAEYRGIGFDAHLDARHVTIEGGMETIDNQIKGVL